MSRMSATATKPVEMRKASKARLVQGRGEGTTTLASRRARRLKEASDEIEQGRFACAARSNDGGDLARRGGHREAIAIRLARMGVAQVIKDEHGPAFR